VCHHEDDLEKQRLGERGDHDAADKGVRSFVRKWRAIQNKIPSLYFIEIPCDFASQLMVRRSSSPTSDTPLWAFRHVHGSPRWSV
jgi:hypothetical protein